jgi:hypothetical protein
MKMAGHKRQFIKNVGSGWLAQTSAAIVGFIILPYNFFIAAARREALAFLLS